MTNAPDYCNAHAALRFKQCLPLQRFWWTSYSGPGGPMYNGAGFAAECGVGSGTVQRIKREMEEDRPLDAAA